MAHYCFEECAKSLPFALFSVTNVVSCFPQDCGHPEEAQTRFLSYCGNLSQTEQPLKHHERQNLIKTIFLMNAHAVKTNWERPPPSSWSWTALTTKAWTYSAKSVDYVHVCEWHICFQCLQRERALSHRETQSDFGFGVSSPSECVSEPSLTRAHMYTLVAKQTQVFGVLLRSQALYGHPFHSDCTGVTDRCPHEKRQPSNKSCSLGPGQERGADTFISSDRCMRVKLLTVGMLTKYGNT